MFPTSQAFLTMVCGFEAQVVQYVVRLLYNSAQLQQQRRQLCRALMLPILGQDSLCLARSRYRGTPRVSRAGNYYLFVGNACIL
jgi:hypothetical protein